MVEEDEEEDGEEVGKGVGEGVASVPEKERDMVCWSKILVNLMHEGELRDREALLGNKLERSTQALVSKNESLSLKSESQGKCHYGF